MILLVDLRPTREYKSFARESDSHHSGNDMWAVNNLKVLREH